MKKLFQTRPMLATTITIIGYLAIIFTGILLLSSCTTDGAGIQNGYSGVGRDHAHHNFRNPR